MMKVKKRTQKTISVLMAVLLLLPAISAMFPAAFAAQQEAEGLPPYKSIAYVTVPASETWSWLCADGQLRWEEDGKTLADEYLASGIDVTKVTHINFAFGMLERLPEYEKVTNEVTTNKVTLVGRIEEMNRVVDGRPYLRALVDLKKQNPYLKVLLSIGGWESGGFCRMAKTAQSRAEFIQSCLDITEEYGLDGIDIDWEYPTNGGWGAIESCTTCVSDFRALIQELRAAMPDKLVTIAAGASQPGSIDLATAENLDYINIMCYDYPGSDFGASKNYIQSFIDIVGEKNKNKLNMGLPFYTGSGPSLIPVRTSGFDAEVSPEVHTAKMQWVKETGLGGGFYWAYSMDTPAGELRNAVFNTLNGEDYQWPDMEPVLKDDIAVVPSGSPYTFSVLENDTVPANQSLTSPTGVAKLENETDYALNSFGNTAQGACGILSINQNGTVTYTPTRFMDQVDSFVYKADAVVNGENVTKYARIEVLPSSSVYYEDNFNAVQVSSGEVDQALNNGNSIAYTGKWSEVGSEGGFSGGVYHQAGAQQVDISFADYKKIAGNENKTYLEYIQYITGAMNDAYDITIDENGKRVVSSPATFTFRFKGTGFELLSYCDDKTGVLECEITGIGNTYSKKMTVSGVYDKAGEALYQVPLVSLDGLAYGEYEVKFTSVGTRTYPSKGNIVVIDGIRIINPLGNAGNVDQYDEAEKYAQEYDLRDMILASPAQAKVVNSIYSAANDTSGSLGYGMDGPKNEVYLRSLNQGVAFLFDPSQVTAPENAVILQLGVSNASGKGALTVTCKAEGGYQKSKTIEIDSSVMKYYDLADLLPSKTAKASFTMIKTGDSGMGTNILSLRKIKTTQGVGFSSDISAFEPAVTGMGISPSLLQIKPGETKSGRVFLRREDGSKVSPNMADITGLEAAISGAGIAELVSFDAETGIFTVKGIALGETVLTAGNGQYTAQQTVSVVTEYQPSEASELLLSMGSVNVKEKASQSVQAIGVVYNTGEEYTLPADGGTLSAESANTAVAEVSVSGQTIHIEGITQGQTDITVSYLTVSGKTITVTVPVTVTALEVVSIAVTPNQLDLNKGKSGTVNVSFVLEDDSTRPGEGFTAVSSDPAVADVEISGNSIVVNGIAQGEATITVSAEGIETTFPVKVTEVLVSSITVAPSSAVAATGGVQLQLTGTISPADASNPVLEWSSDKPQTASVDQNGLVTVNETSSPRTMEEVTITASSSNGISAQCTLSVYDISCAEPYVNGKTYTGGMNNYTIVIHENKYWFPKYWTNSTPSDSDQSWLMIGSVENKITGVTITTQDLEVSTGGTLALEAQVGTVGTPDTSLVWTVVSGGAYASIDSATGVVTGIAQGAATVRAASVSDPSKYDEAVITVSAPKPVTSIEIQGGTSVIEGKKLQLTAKVLPTGAANKTVTWASSNPLAAVVDQTGLVTGVAVGTTVITATANDGSGVIGRLEITVESAPALTSLTITPVTVGSYTKGKWMKQGDSCWWLQVADHTAKTITEPGTYYYVFTTGGGADHSDTTAKLVVDDKFNITVSDASFKIDNTNGTASFTDLSTNYAVLTETSLGNYTIGWDVSRTARMNAVPKMMMAAPAAISGEPAYQAALVGNSSVVTGAIPENGKMSNYFTSAAYMAAAEIASAAAVTASNGYSLTPKAGYTTLEDAYRTMTPAGDQSDVVAIFLNGTMTAEERTGVLIESMASLLQTVHELSPNAKILLVGSRGDYMRYMQDAAEAAGMEEITSFLEDTVTGISGSNALEQQKEMADALRNKMIQILR